MAARDFLLIEAVLYALWAPVDANPAAPARLLEEGPLTNNDVYRARRALMRIERAARDTRRPA